MVGGRREEARVKTGREAESEAERVGMADWLIG